MGKLASFMVVGVIRMIRDRSAIFFVFIMPLGIILIVGALFGEGFSPVLGVVDQADGQLSSSLTQRLVDSDGIDVSVSDSPEDLLLRVERGSIDAGLIIPAEYEQLATSPEPVAVEFLIRTDSAGPQLRTAVGAAVSEEAAIIRAARFAQDQGVILTLDEVRSIDSELSAIQIFTQTVGEEGFFSGLSSPFELGAASQLVLFMFLTGTTSAAILIQNRRLGLSTRMFSTPTSIWTIVSGESLAMFSVVLVQGIYIVLTTWAFFGVVWGGAVEVGLILLAFGLVSASVSVLLGSVFKNDQQAGGIGVLASLGLAALGGAMVPIEFFSDTMQTVARFIPHSWAIEAFIEVGRQNGGLADIYQHLLVLGGFALLFGVLASWRLWRAITTS